MREEKWQSDRVEVLDINHFNENEDWKASSILEMQLRTERHYRSSSKSNETFINEAIDRFGCSPIATSKILLHIRIDFSYINPKRKTTVILRRKSIFGCFSMSFPSVFLCDVSINKNARRKREEKCLLISASMHNDTC